MERKAYTSPETYLWEMQQLLVIAQSLTSEPYDNPLLYDGF